MMGIEAKIQRLQQILQGYGKVAVAFSGGVDSSVLLDNASTCLGKRNTVAMQAISCLISKHSINQSQALLAEQFAARCQYHAVNIHPLQWKEVVANTEERCYFCKKRVYSMLKNEMDSLGCTVLVDGTNVDDLKDRRPGLRAIRELGVKTPLLDAGLNKSEIRLYAKQVGLANHDLPSNSCLATRIPTNTRIHEGLLGEIEEAEEFLHELGFSGCRVRPQGSSTIVEVLYSDLERFMERSQRVTILHYFRSAGLDNIYLNVAGRSNT